PEWRTPALGVLRVSASGVLAVLAVLAVFYTNLSARAVLSPRNLGIRAARNPQEQRCCSLLFCCFPLFTGDLTIVSSDCVHISSGDGEYHINTKMARQPGFTQILTRPK